MIHVNRSQIAPPKSLTDADGPGARETQQVIDFYSNQANQDKPFQFKAYSGDEVKQKLNELFHYKCAYCESYFGATQPVDVEHFRPKGGVLVNGQQKGKGYYWLAAKWDNLLPACIDCNRPRTQEVFDQHAQVLGKATEFPIAHETKRATAPGQEKQEERLLLNPCLDEPDKHLVFEVEGEDDVVVRPAKLSNGGESRKGKESIRVYALQRSGLVGARRSRLKIIKAHLAVIDILIKTLDANPANLALDGLLKQEMAEIKRLQDDDQEYAGMARQYVKRIMG